MENWMGFVEAHSLVVLHGLPWEEKDFETRDLFEALWSLLRRSVVYFLKYEMGQHTEDRILEAQKWLVEYGRLAEEV